VLLLSLSGTLLLRLPSERIAGDCAFDNRSSFQADSLAVEVKHSRGRAAPLPSRYGPAIKRAAE
jgi:hypothetical protein